jgi:hypothetical protein
MRSEFRNNIQPTFLGPKTADQETSTNRGQVGACDSAQMETLYLL